MHKKCSSESLLVATIVFSLKNVLYFSFKNKFHTIRLLDNDEENQDMEVLRCTIKDTKGNVFSFSLPYCRMLTLLYSCLIQDAELSSFTSKSTCANILVRNLDFI